VFYLLYPGHALHHGSYSALDHPAAFLYHPLDHGNLEESQPIISCGLRKHYKESIHHCELLSQTLSRITTTNDDKELANDVDNNHHTSSSPPSFSAIFIPSFCNIHSKAPVTIFLPKYSQQILDGFADLVI
jgi:hypothetical protein